MRKRKLEYHLSAVRSARRGAVLRIEDLIANPAQTVKWLQSVLLGNNNANPATVTITEQQLTDTQQRQKQWPSKIFESQLLPMMKATGSSPIPVGQLREPDLASPSNKLGTTDLQQQVQSPTVFSYRADFLMNLLLH